MVVTEFGPSIPAAIQFQTWMEAGIDGPNSVTIMNDLSLTFQTYKMHILVERSPIYPPKFVPKFSLQP
jgi:hypothetical protein